MLLQGPVHPGVKRNREALQQDAVWDFLGLRSLTAKKTGRHGWHLAVRVAPDQSVGSSRVWEFSSALRAWLFLLVEGGTIDRLNKTDNRKIIPI